MENNLKIKVIGVLRDGNICKTTRTTDQIAGSSAHVNGESAGRSNVARSMAAKINPLDLAGILNCRRRLEWTKEWLRKNQAEFQSKENLQKEIQLRRNEVHHLNCFLDITESQYRYLVKSLAPLISTLEPQRKKKSFSAEERIAITLKYLATGEVHSCRNYCFLASKPVILKMISEICLKMYELLKDEYLELPKTEEQWLKVAGEYKNKIKLPNCLGSLVLHEMNLFKKPALLFTTIVDANYNFLYADVEEIKTSIKENIFENSNIKRKIETKEFLLPPHDNVNDIEDVNKSYYFAGHGSLPVQSYLMSSYNFVPFSKDPSAYFCGDFDALNYKFCWGMDESYMQTKCTIRMFLNLFNIFLQPMRGEPEDVRKITLGCIALYNFLRKSDKDFAERTEKFILVHDQEEIIVDDEGVIIDEDIRFREENRPNVIYYSCIERTHHKQKSDSIAGLDKRNKIRDYIAKYKLMD